MHASVIVCTYEQPRELGFALCALARQTVAPDEVFVADDGSGEATARVVEHWAERSPFPVQHVRQVDKGYRKSRIVNEAVRRSSGEHLIFLDGDSFPHRAWVGDHLAAANGRRVLCGRRVKLGPIVSTEITTDDVERGRFDAPVRALVRSRMRGDVHRLGLGVRLPSSVARLLHPRARKLMGVNYSLPRAVFYDVNGYDERWTFYGREDFDLELRLRRAGHPFYALLNRAVVFHTYHDERERSAECEALVETARASTTTRCEVGVDAADAFDATT